MQRGARTTSCPPDALAKSALKRDLLEGEHLAGVVRKVPVAGEFHGNRLIIETDNGTVVSLPATAKKGWTVLERELDDVKVGDRIDVHFVCWRARRDGNGRYRVVHVERLGTQR